LGTNKVHTVTNTCSSYYYAWNSYPNKLPERKKKAFRFITISSYYSHKNLELIPKVLEKLQQKEIRNVEFVLTLKEEDFYKHIGPHPRIYNLGPVKPTECSSLYAECDALFLPTLAECFSASYPEAMIMELPIITTDLGFARSICGEAALYYEAKNAIAAADAIESLMNNSALKQQLIAEGRKQLRTFDTPEERARKYLKLGKTLSSKQ
jgi:glycosyltransferase involved in cell wall biosynthesis